MELTPFFTPSVIEPTAQALAVIGGAVTVATRNRVAISRVSGLGTIFSVAAFYACRYSHQPEPATLAILGTLSISATRVGLFIIHDFSDNTRKCISATSFGLATLGTVGFQISHLTSFSVSTLFALSSLGFGAVMDYTKNMVVRRRFAMLGGMSSLACASSHTLVLGWAIKSFFCDVVLNGWYMWKYKDPLPQLKELRPFINWAQRNLHLNHN